jgi:hypothetical protein
MFYFCELLMCLEDVINEWDINWGNFLQMIKILASYNKKVDKVFMKNVPQNAIYISPTIQKEILHVFASKMELEKTSTMKFFITC